MTREEALYHTQQCQHHAGKLREHIAMIYERRGYEALGYTTFEEWAEHELNTGYQWALKMRNAHVVQQELASALPIEHLPTKHAEQLHKLETPEQKISAYQRAGQMAAAEGAGIATRHVQRAVEIVMHEQAVTESDYPVIAHMMASGDITPAHARKLVNAVDAVDPAQRVYVITLIGRYGLKDVALIPNMAQLATRPEASLRTEVDSGYLNSKPLAQATLTDWDAALQEAQRHNISKSQDDRRTANGIDAKIITLYATQPGGNVEMAAEQNWRVLQRELRIEDILKLKECIENALEVQRESHRI